MTKTMMDKEIRIQAPEEVIKKLDELGFDWERNTTEMVREVWFEICRAIKEDPDK